MKHLLEIERTYESKASKADLIRQGQESHDLTAWYAAAQAYRPQVFVCECMGEAFGF